MIHPFFTSADPKTVTADPVEKSAVSIAYYLQQNRCISPIIFTHHFIVYTSNMTYLQRYCTTDHLNKYLMEYGSPAGITTLNVINTSSEASY